MVMISIFNHRFIFLDICKTMEEEERETKQKRKWRRGVGKEVERKNTSCSHGESFKNKQENRQVAMEVPRDIFF